MNKQKSTTMTKIEKLLNRQAKINRKTEILIDKTTEKYAKLMNSNSQALMIGGLKL